MKQTDKSENKRGKLVNRLLVLAQIFFVLGLATVALTTVSFVRNRNQKRNEFNRSLEAVQIQLQSD
ncbi:MAG: hypothetical protein K1Y36_29430, partial [Blastocatellia bacterium]|nr:hypothetical protein [Blastocatellia bacterium]